MTDFSPTKASCIKNSIAGRLTIYILLFSSAITLIGTSLQLYLDYSEDIGFIKDSMHQIKTSNLSSIVKNLWVSDSEHIELELASILELPDMQHIQIIKDDKVLYSFGNPQTDSIISQTFPLDYTFKGKNINLGTLHVVASLKGVYQRLYDKVLVILATQAIKTFLVSFFILFLFYYLVGRHLLVMAQYANTLDLDHLDNPLIINQKKKNQDKPDELIAVAAAINAMRINLKKDIAARYKIEGELKKSYALLGAIIDGTTDAIFLKDIEGRYLLANKATLEAIGKSKEEVIGKNDTELFPQKTVQVIKDVDSSVLESGETHLVEERLETTYGDTFWLTNKSPFRDKNNNIIGLIGISKNITELKKSEKEKEQLQDKLRQAHKMEAIGTMAGGIAHDFNNILAAIIGYTEIAKSDFLDGKNINSDLDAVLKASLRAKDLVKQILTFSRMSSRVESHNTINLCLIVKEVLNFLRPIIPATIKIQADVDENCGQIKGDPTQVHQVIMNFCTNAVHVMEEKGGTLEVGLHNIELYANDLKTEPNLHAGAYVRLSVSDTGCGMTPEFINKIFDPYFTTKEVGKGSGMGLAVVQGIVSSHGGFIKVESEPGKGSTFNVFFPRIKEEIILKCADTNEAIPTGTERILFVDDEEWLSNIGKSVLERQGYFVTAKTDSAEAFKIFQNDPAQFDLVITDQTMPNIPGSELAKKILEIRPDIPIILCTGFSSMISEEKAKELGIKKFLMKPVSKNDIAMAVREVLDINKLQVR